MSNQLLKRGQKGYENIFPKTYLDAIKDRATGVSLLDIINNFNMLFLSYTGDAETTRLSIIPSLRKEGLWITYVDYDSNVITEWYNGKSITDEEWQKASNWRKGSNSLVGDISITSDGYWVINGLATEAKAQGEQGITPLLRFSEDYKLEVSYNEGKTYNALGNITNYLRILRYIGPNESLPTSGISEGTIYMKGPVYDETDTLNEYPIYRMWVYAWKNNTLAWQDNGEFQSISAGIVQETGNNENVVMSQKAVTDAIDAEATRANNAEKNIASMVQQNAGNINILRSTSATKAELNAEAERAQGAEDDLNANTGISEYHTFDPAVDYAVGDVVKYEGRLYRFTTEHAQGEWIGTDAEKWSERKEVNKIYLEFVRGKFIDSLGRLATAVNDSYGGTLKYYRVKGGATYKTNCYSATNFYLAFYDENKNFISTILTDKRKKWSFTAPENAVYARFSHQLSDVWGAIYYESYDLLTQVREDIEAVKEANKDDMDKAKPLILDGYAGRVLSFLRQEKGGNVETRGDIIVNRTFSEESTKSNIEWRAYDSTTDKLTYAFASVGWGSTIRLNPNTVIVQNIKNTSGNTIDISVGIGLSRDWSSAIKYYRISIAAGETKNIVFTENDWKESSYYSENCAVYCTIALFGRDGLPRPSVGGSLEWMISYKETYVLVDRANEAYKSEDSNHANEADWAKESSLARNVYTTANAGWKIGGFAKDAVFRDEPHPSYKDGYIKGAMTVEVVDERTVRLTTNIAADEVGSAYRGVYWKIYFDSLADIKGLWTLYNTYSGYNIVKISSAIKDWGPTEKNVINLSSAGLGSKKTWNFYDAITTFKEEQEALGDKSKWTGLIEQQGFFYLIIVRYDQYGKLPIIEDTLQLDHEPISKRVIATELTDSLKREIKEEISPEEDVKQVTCWGDSLTAGAGSDKHYNQETVLDSIKAKGFSIGLSSTDSITYAKMLQELLGGEYNVTNCGVGGESINTIAARMGANMGKLPFDVVIPANKSKVLIGNNVTEGEKILGTWSSSVIQPLLQGHGNSVNPCYIEGVECTLTAAKDSYSGTWDRNYYVARTTGGDRDITIPAGTPIIMGGSKLYRNTEIAILWCWQNGGFSDLNDLINKLKRMVAHIGNKKYIIVGLHSGNATNRKEQEDTLVAEFGDKFFNWRRYVSSNALYDFGITPTTDSNFTEEQLSSGVKSDMTAMSEGSLPSSLWRNYVGDESGATTNDSIHLNAAGYAILGYKLYERMKVLGYV